MEDVKHRVINCIDLVHVEAVYHEECKNWFFLVKEAPVIAQHFNRMCAWLEETIELYSMEELYNHLKEFAGGSEEDA